MNKSKIIETSISAIIALLFFTALNYTYPYHLMYSEDRSWFLTSWNYAKEVISEPAGLACYVGAFITQFLYFKTIGPAIIALLLFITERLIASISKAKCRAWIPLCWIPIVLIVKFILHTYSTLTPFAGIIICLLTIKMINYLKLWKWRLLLFMLSLPFVLYTTGMCGIIVAFYAIYDIIYQKTNSKNKAVIILGIITLTQATLLWIAYVSELTILTINCGPYYTTYNSGGTEANNIIIAIVAILFITHHLKCPSKNGWRYCATIASFICVPLAYFNTIDHKTAKEDESLIKMFIHGSREQWNEVKKLAKEHRPEDGNSMNYYNLALARDGKLLDKLIENTGDLGLKNILPEMKITLFIPKIFACNLFQELKIYSHVYLSAIEAQNCLVGKWQLSPSVAYWLGRTSAECGDSINALKFKTLLSKTLFHKELSTKIGSKLEDNRNNIKTNYQRGLFEAEYSSRNGTPKELSISEIHNLFRTASSSPIGYQYLLAIDLFYGNFEMLKDDIDACPFKKIKHSRIIQEAYSFCLLKDNLEKAKRPYWIKEDAFNQARAYISSHNLGVPPVELTEKFKGTYFAIIEKYSNQPKSTKQ